MKKLYKTSLLGYQKRQVDEVIVDLKKDYEEELDKKKDRLMELKEENYSLKTKLEAYEQKLSFYIEQEAFISKALVRAEEKAQVIVEEGQRKVQSERQKVLHEQDKWKCREKEIRRELLDFQKKVYDVMETFYSEINYLTSKEVYESIEQQEAEEDNHQDSDILKVSAS